ncbi:16S rRNA (guanine(527)-N(7))-methyltransferase RsmG [Mesomycoplasma hyopneumoniae]|uniref:16S rRNA (guanine(527)-N(7))-methyltransferase RsmG n=1 Tax=Mesomycoplasma hyopneumoniae TaxID=2099 RepID=UPI003857D79B
MYKRLVQEFLPKLDFENLEKYVNLIEFSNKNFNLTAFSGDILWKEGIFESIFTMNFIVGLVNNKENKKLKILDIGAGSGFPSIPFLITNPEIKLTISESMQKRCQFLKDVSEKLDLKFNLICKPVQEIDPQKFDIITARAVANLEKLEKITKKIHFPKTLLAFIKGPKVFNEVQNCKNCNYKIIKVNNNINKKIFIAFKQVS